MIICYIDESGTSSIPGNTSHFVLSGISIPVDKWKTCDNQISKLKAKWNLGDSELHTGWMLRSYVEQNKIPNFETLTHEQRRHAIHTLRKSEIFRLQKTKPRSLKSVKKNYRFTEDYIHLTHEERKQVIIELSETIASWGFARLFAECIDKVHFDPAIGGQSVDEQAFEQIVSRFEQFLQIISSNTCKHMGLLIHDNNETVSKKLTNLMIQFHKKGTLWTDLTNLIETPLFVDSKLTSMVQVADLCSYSLRRYLENKETYLFNNIFQRADRKYDKVVGVRHFTQSGCSCVICRSRKQNTLF